MVLGTRLMKHAAVAIVLAIATSGCLLDPDSEPAAKAAHQPSLRHEPPRFTPLSDQPWNTLTGNGWSYLRRASSEDDDIVVDDTAPISPQRVLRIVFTPDMGKDREPSVHWMRLPNAEELYSAWSIRLSTNWTPSPAGGGKMTFLHVQPDGLGQVYSGVFGSKAPHHVSINTEWEPYGQKIWDPNVTTTAIEYGRWYVIEWYAKWPAAGSTEGTFRWWVNGTLNGDYDHVAFPLGGIGFAQFEFAPTLQNAPPADQYMYVDHTYVSIP